MKAMVDTHVLILGCRTPKPKDDERIKAKCAAARALLVQLPEIRLSAVAWFEFNRALRDHERTWLERLRGKLFVEAVDVRVIDRAVDLFNKRRKVTAICRECLGALVSHPCKGCGNAVASTQRINDAIIVASADVHDSVSVLFSDDDGVHDFALDVDPRSCNVQRPPPPDGDLFREVHARLVK
jgi:hypothetical protein